MLILERLYNNDPNINPDQDPLEFLGYSTI